MKKGFTLVELSIVLVIIGLLIGGILVAQSLIDSTKINRFIRDVAQYEVATQQFFSKFKQIPGDSNHFAPPGTNDLILGSGVGGGNCALTPDTTYGNREDEQFWGHLSQANMLSKDFEIFAPTNNCSGPHENHRLISNAGVLWPYLETRGTKSPVLLQKPWQNGNISFVFGGLGLVDLLALESKLNVQAPAPNTQQQFGLVNLYGPGNCWDGNTFSVVTCASLGDSASGTLYYRFLPQ